MALRWWEKVYGTFPCIIGVYMQRWNFQDFHQMSEPGREGQSSFTMSRLNQKWKILGDNLVSQAGGVNHLSTFDLELRYVSFALISFMGFSATLSALQPFQICIYKRKYSKLTFSNDSQLMGRRFMANLHSSFESACKSRISKISTRCQNQGGWSPFYFWSWSQKWRLCIDIFYGVSCNIKYISNLHLQEKI